MRTGNKKYDYDGLKIIWIPKRLSLNRLQPANAKRAEEG
jgi:hypothetical protein